MLPCSALGTEPGDRVLDLCASPGGKSLQAAAALDGKGFLVSNDLNSSRMTPLIRNIELAGIENCAVTNETPDRLALRLGDYFDKIIIDTPCSGEGMFRKDPDAALAWDKSKSERLSRIQYGLLENAGKMLKPGGKMVYSTCTFAPEENELLIQRFLDENAGFETVPVDHDGLGVSQARTDWAAFDGRLGNAARIFPHIHKGEGHFAAVIKKSEEGKVKSEGRKGHCYETAGKDDIELFNEAVGNCLTHPIEKTVYKHKDTLFIPPDGMPDLRGLRIYRAGLSLGTVRNKRFIPSHAFALSLNKDTYTRVIDYKCGDVGLDRFLRGEAYETDAVDGYNLICADGYSVGMGKVGGGRLKWRTK